MCSEAKTSRKNTSRSVELTSIETAAFKSDKQKIAKTFQVRVSLDDFDFMPSEDITPGIMQPVVFTNDDGDRDLELMYWSFTFPKRLTFNTRSDNILKPGLWKNSFEDRRCVVPADSFFEWNRPH
jgi:putative SOS response-associated peptidase YedK